MTIFRCKMCGGNLEIQEGASFCTCEFCGVQQTLPTVKDEGLQTLFNRANVLRLKSEFDKAADVYEKILQNNDSEAEAYWGLILCKYGIEYVEDPKTFKRIPTCHRASFDAVTADEDYKNAIKYADAFQKKIYEDEATAVDEIQKGIIALAQKEDPYDVFICYKETDENGKRTQDSVLANDIYHQLTMEGLKVFYAAISLEDKLGSEYEPYIFSALTTSKVMIVMGTKPEYFNAVWVKNEWSRFLKIMKKNRSKLLIPCYKDMDPYELPEEFAHLQAQDMGKIGFINDVVRGIRKVTGKEKDQPKAQENAAIQQTVSGTSAIAQIKRGNMAIEDGEWDKAEAFFEEALNIDPECAEAYLGKLLVKERKSSWAELLDMYKNRHWDYTEESLYACEPETEHIKDMTEKYAVVGYYGDSDSGPSMYLDSYGTGSISSEYGFNRTYRSRLSSCTLLKEDFKKELASERLISRIQQYAGGKTKSLIEDGISTVLSEYDGRITTAQKEDEASIERIKSEYKKKIAQADEIVKRNNLNAQELRESDYQKAVQQMNSANDIQGFERPKTQFLKMAEYKDSKTLIEKCQSEILRIREEKRLEEERRAEERRLEEKRRAEEKRIADAKAEEERRAAIKKRNRLIVILAAVAAVAVAFLIVLFTVIIPDSRYNAAMELYENGQYEEAIAAFEAMDGYKDSADMLLEAKYAQANELYGNGQYEEAIAAFEAMDGYKDSAEKISEICRSDEYLKTASAGSYIYLGSYEQDNDTSNGKEEIEWLVLDKQGNSLLLVSKYALDCQQYNASYTAITWEQCTLRTWLNGTFINKAFSTEEQALIGTTTVTADKNPEYSTDPGNDTQDKIFLFSITEAEKYFSSDDARKCEATAYAKAQGADTNDSNACWWWLRSPGYSSNYAAYVYYDGGIYYTGGLVYGDSSAVRPALWINLES